MQSFKYKCPNCGHSFTACKCLNRVTCRKCKNTWITSYSNNDNADYESSTDYQKDPFIFGNSIFCIIITVAGFVVGFVLSYVLDVIFPK